MKKIEKEFSYIILLLILTLMLILYSVNYKIRDT